MILQKMPHYVDSILTQEDASAALQDGQVVVGHVYKPGECPVGGPLHRIMR